MKVFQIGFNKCGTKFLTQLFDLNGYRGIHWEGGKLANDIIYSKASGSPPLKPWVGEYTVFTDMESVHRYGQPLLEGYKEFEYLDKSFPDSVFILNTRDVEDWIISRYMHQNGAYANFYAQHYKVEIDQLADIWHKDWIDHIAACRQYFSRNEKFIEINIDTAEPEDYRQTLLKWFNLPVCPPLPDKAVLSKRQSYLNQLKKILWTKEKKHKFTPDEIDYWARILTNSSIPHVQKTQAEDFKACSQIFAKFSVKSASITKQDGTSWPILEAGPGVYVSEKRKDKLYRIVGIVNEISQITNEGTYNIDLQDGRQLGVSESNKTGAPVITYCRRQFAENVYLFPLPEYHSIGSDYFPGKINKDERSFKDKLDRVVWRGSLSGPCSDVKNGVFSSPSHQVLDKIVKSSDNSLNLNNPLRQNVRFSFVSENFGKEGFDVAITSCPATIAAFTKIKMDHLLDNFRRENFIYKHRYIVSLRGYDTGSNFLMGADSQSVVFKEEDGWEVFYSLLFKPWEHYIPLEAGAVDVEEKLSWARLNYDECQKISLRARMACSVLANHEIRKKYLDMLLSSYRNECGNF